MKRRLIIGIVGSFILSIAVIVFLIGLSGMLKDKHNSFLRLFPSHPVLESTGFDLKVNSYYLAGGTAHHIYLANYASPLHMLVINVSRADTQHVSLKVKGITDQKFWALNIKVDSPNFYVSDGAIPRIYKGNVQDWSAEQFAYDQEFFLDYEPMGSSSIAIKSLDKTGRESMLGQISTDSPHYLFKPGLLKKQVDGVFCVDGIMQFNKELNKLVYLYRYRNEYLVIDSNLNLITRGKTIDTTSVAKIKVVTIASSGSRTMSRPPLIVNNRSAVYRNWLFVNSRLLSKNEHPSALEAASVIDVYDLTETRYRFSFYVFRYNRKEKLNQFVVSGDRFIALFETHLQIFDLNNEYFPRKDLSHNF